MRYGSVCSGIEAATVAWHPLGWEPSFFSEIDKFPRAVLERHYPEIPLHGDFTTIGADQYGAIDVLVGGTPCQSFSVAGLRGGLDDDRGNLALEFLRLAERTRPLWVVWENVPGVLSSNGGRDFGSILGGLGELGFGFAYRVLDAQYFGVAQRRRRVFVVGCSAGWRYSAAVLFECQSLRRDYPPQHRRPPRLAGGPMECPGVKVLSPGQANAELTDNISLALNCNRDGAPIAFHENQRGELTTSETTGALAGPGGKPGQGYPAVMFKPSHYTRGKDGAPSEICPPLSADADKGDQDPVLFQPRYVRNGRGAPDSIAAPLTAEAGKTGKGDGAQCVATAMAVRRLTPTECERLQGFPDGYTAIPWRGKPVDQCPDGPRYKALGNSMAVPVMRWIGERIQQVQGMIDGEAAA